MELIVVSTHELWREKDQGYRYGAFVYRLLYVRTSVITGHFRSDRGNSLDSLISGILKMVVFPDVDAIMSSICLSGFLARLS